MTISALYPSIRPSLLLDFANTRQLDPRVTFARASTGTFYDGIATAMAEQNLLTYSQDFDNAAWTTGNVTVTANTTTAPDGTATADSLLETAATAQHKVQQPVTVGSKTNYTVTCSVYVKPNGRDWCVLQVSDSGSRYYASWINVSTGAIGSSISGETSGNVTTVTASTNGFYRVSITSTIATVASAVRFDIFPASADGVSSYAGDITKGLYLWGAQLEQRSTVTAYTPTTTAAITNYIPVMQTALANQPRFNVDPVTEESQGLLIEEQRTNLFTYSSQFDNAIWSQVAVTVQPDVVVAPDGTQSADKIVPTTANTQHRLQPTTAMTSGTAYTLTVYAKAGGYSSVWLRTANDVISASFNLLTGTIYNISGTGTYSITSVGNGWYRCSVTGTAATTGSLYSRINVQDGNDSFVGDGYSGIYIWGAQVEAGSFATSYIPTVASQVTRSADSASMTGVNFSSWYRADEGTLYAEASSLAVSGGNGAAAAGIAFEINDGSTNNRTSLMRSTGNAARLISTANGTTYCDISTGSWPQNTATKSSASYLVNNFAITAGGVAVATDNSGLVSSNASIAVIGGVQSSISTVNSINGTIKRIAYYPKRLSNTELQSLTLNV